MTIDLFNTVKLFVVVCLTLFNTVKDFVIIYYYYYL